MKFKLIKSDEPMLTDDYYKLANNLGLDINIQVCEDVYNGNTFYVVNEFVDKGDNSYLKQIKACFTLNQAKKCARDYLFNKAFGEEFIKSNDKGNIKQY